MFRIPAFAALCLAAVPAFAQNQTTPAPAAPAGPPPEAIAAIQQAAMAFGQCVNTGAQGVAATVTPEAGAASVMSSCSTQLQALEGAANALIATLPEEQRAGAQAQLRSRVGGAEAEIANGIRQARAAPATTPAPAPAQ